MDSTADAACALSLCSTMLFPASLIPEGEIMIGVGQHMPFSRVTLKRIANPSAATSNLPMLEGST